MPLPKLSKLLISLSLSFQTPQPDGPALLDDIAFMDYMRVEGEWDGLIESSAPASAPNIVLDQVVGKEECGL